MFLHWLHVSIDDCCIQIHNFVFNLFPIQGKVALSSPPNPVLSLVSITGIFMICSIIAL